MNTAEEIRQKVAESYAAAVTGRTGCCGPTARFSGGCCGATARQSEDQNQAESRDENQAEPRYESQAEPKGESNGGAKGEPATGEPGFTGVAALAGYTADDVTGLPEDAVANSFGCGNPLAFSQVREGDVVLDLGSGAGIDLLLAAKRVGPTGRVIGVDMTDAMIDRARQNIAQAGATNVEVRKGIIEELPVESGSVDWVISNCVINLSPEKDKVFAEIARVLKPGGHFLISDIVVKDFPELLRKSLTLYSACVGGAISEEEYLEGLRKAGLEDVGVDSRTVYDAASIRGFVEDELVDPGPIVALLNQLGITTALSSYFEGKVWSAKVHGRKPAA